MPLNLFSKRPDWLFRALGLQEPPVPDRLETGLVQPVIDVFQSGWGVARFTVGNHPIVQSTAAGDLELLEAGQDGFVVIGFAINDNTAGGGEYRVMIKDSILNRFVYISIDTLAGGDRKSYKDLFGGIYPLYVPPGTSLVLRHPATGVGETILVNLLSTPIPAGFKAI